MAPKRLPISRVAGIAAWTTATVAWGTAVVAVANVQPAEEATVDEFIEAAPAAVVQYQATEAPMPNMPTDGLVVLRYTPTPKPKAQRRVVTTVVSSPGKTTAPAKTAAPAKKQAKSGGS